MGKLFGEKQVRAWLKIKFSFLKLCNKNNIEIQCVLKWWIYIERNENHVC